MLNIEINNLRKAKILSLFFLASICISVFCYSVNMHEDIHAQRRQKMVDQQIKTRGIYNKDVLNAMLTVERHLFVPSYLINRAYDDSPLPIGYKQTISQPYIVAFMTEILNLNSNEKVLEVGTGSGYQAAILAEICAEVYSIEVIEPLAKSASALLDSLGYNNVIIKHGDGYQGWPEHAPFDAIIVTCAPSHIPQPIQDQLAEGGKLIIPYGRYGAQQLFFLKKINGKIKKKAVLPVRFVPMIDLKGEEY